MAADWQQTFHKRMKGFERKHIPPKDAVSVSIKIRVTSGCFHRQHSPRAYELIDKSLDKLESVGEFSFEEHESGPEILIYVAATTAVISLAKSVIDLIVAILKARSEGIKKGDDRTDPLEIIVRRVQKSGEFREERILRINHQDKVDKSVIDKIIKRAISELLKEKKDTR